jgi:hypothetical protein
MDVFETGAGAPLSSGPWRDLLINAAWLRGHHFGDTVMIAQQHEEHVHLGLREAHQPLPRLVGTQAEWERIGWRVLDGAFGYRIVGQEPGPTGVSRVYALSETAPVNVADRAMFDQPRPPDIGGREHLWQQVWNDLAVGLGKQGYEFAYSFSADAPTTIVDARARMIRLPGALPLPTRVAHLVQASATLAARPTLQALPVSDRVGTEIVTASAAHIVLYAAGLDPDTVPFPSTSIDAGPGYEFTAAQIVTIGETARRGANQILPRLSTPVHGDGTIRVPEPSRPAAPTMRRRRPPTAAPDTASGPEPSTRRTDPAGPEL